MWPNRRSESVKIQGVEMSEPRILSKPPIVEAVVDIDCDMLPAQDLATLEATGREHFSDQYPKFRPQFIQAHQIELKADGAPKVSARRGLQALLFLHDDEKQLVQVRALGFSFNRLAPYTNLDHYLPEIARTWRLFVNVATPIQVQAVRLRYINRIKVPLVDGRVELGDYFGVSPQLPDGTGLRFRGFLNQHAAVEEHTGNTADIILATQPADNGVLPVIFDITVASIGVADSADWNSISQRILSLRSLKNRIFSHTLTERCFSLFQ
jgi:uncharacterized protein (TIGR04255 family)